MPDVAGKISPLRARAIFQGTSMGILGCPPQTPHNLTEDVPEPPRKIHTPAHFGGGPTPRWPEATRRLAPHSPSFPKRGAHLCGVAGVPSAGCFFWQPAARMGMASGRKFREFEDGAWQRGAMCSPRPLPGRRLRPPESAMGAPANQRRPKRAAPKTFRSRRTAVGR